MKEFIKQRFLLLKPLTESPLTSCFRMGFGVCDKFVIIFERAGFTEKNTDLLLYLFKQKEFPMGGIFFIDCSFNTSYEILDGINQNICFRHCDFTNEVNITGDITKYCVFDKCSFGNILSFRKIVASQKLGIQRCLFKEESYLDLEDALVEGELIIEDTIFKGNFSLKNANIKGGIHLDCVSFIKAFDFTDIKLNKTGIKLNKKQYIRNIATTSTELSLKDTKILVDALKDNGYQDHQIEAMGLDTFNRSSKIEFLKPQKAAGFVYKSAGYLQKLRDADRKNGATMRSIPFKEDGRTILYPEDALIAFREQDWEKLKILREKYKYNPKKV